MKNISRFILCFFLAFTAYILTPTTSNARGCFPCEGPAANANGCGPCQKCVAHPGFPIQYCFDYERIWWVNPSIRGDRFWRMYGECVGSCLQPPPQRPHPAPPKPQVCPLNAIYSGAVQPGGSELKNTQGIDTYQLKIDASNCSTSNNVSECCSHSQCPDLCVLLVSTYPSAVDCPSPTNPNAQCSKLQTAMNTYMQVDPQTTIPDIAAALADVSPSALLTDLGGSFDMALFCQGYCSSSTPITAAAPQVMQAVNDAVSFEATGGRENFQSVALPSPSYFPPPIKRDRFGRLKWRAPQKN